MKKYILELAVFVSGAVVMIFELDGSRIMAPYLGTSLFVWTSLIGIILGSLSLGYYLGGRLADRYLHTYALALILVTGAILMIIIALTKDIALAMVSGAIRDIRLGSVIGALLLFFPSSLLFGLVSPYAIRLKLSSIDTSGRTVGKMYAISTVGSIVGTFAAGFWLIPFFGNTKILFILSSILFAAALVIFWPRLPLRLKTTGLLLLAAGVYLAQIFLPSGLGLADVDSYYYRIIIKDTKDYVSGRTIRVMQTDPFGIQGGIFLESSGELPYDYAKFFRLVDHFVSSNRNTLVLGGGVYIVPMDLVRRNEQLVVDVVEIDPTITELSSEYFGFTGDPRINITHEDGRIYLNNNKKLYDSIFVDVFGSYLSLPFHMTTRESFAQISRSLNDGGVMIVNVISALAGEKSDFLRAELATLKQVFPQVYLFPVNSENPATTVQNIMVVALKSDQIPAFTNADSELNGYLKNRTEIALEKTTPILTDDYAPVDYYTQKFLSRR